MSASQTVRTAPIDLNNHNNPTNVALDIKPSRILTGTIAPSSIIGTLLDYYIDTVTGNFYFKNTAGVWILIYNFVTTPSTGLTDLNNLGTGQQIYSPPPVSGIANLRSLVSNSGKITFVTEPNDISLGVNLTNSDVGLGLVMNVKNNYTAVVNPTVSDDSSQNYSIGSYWWNSLLTRLYFCDSASVGAAVWVLVNPNATGFITNCANVGSGLYTLFAGLSGSIANFCSLTSSDNSLLISQAANTIDLKVPVPSGIFKDVFNGGFTDVVTTSLIIPGFQYVLNQPWGYNTGYSRGTWSVPSPVIQRNGASSGSPPYFYNVQCNFQMQSNFTVAVSQSKITFLLWPITGNVSFPPNFNPTTNCFVGPGNAIRFGGTINTIMVVTDNSPAQINLQAFTDTNQNITNINTQITIIQI